MKINICQVCGKKYDKCKTPYISDGYFRWTDVACSPACAAKYLAQLDDKKNNANSGNTEKRTKKSKRVASQSPIDETELQSKL